MAKWNLWEVPVITSINFPDMIDVGSIPHFIKFPVEHITIKLLLLSC